MGCIFISQGVKCNFYPHLLLFLMLEMLLTILQLSLFFSLLKLMYKVNEAYHFNAL